MRALTAAVVCAVGIAGGVGAKEPRGGSPDRPAAATLEGRLSEVGSQPISEPLPPLKVVPLPATPRLIPAALAELPCGSPHRTETTTGAAIAEFDRLIVQLAEAGLVDEAARLKALRQEVAAKIAKQLAEKTAESERLAEQIRGLRQLIGRQKLIAIRLQVLEVDPVHLAKLGLDRCDLTAEQQKILPASFVFTPFEANSADGRLKMNALQAAVRARTHYACLPCGEVEAAIRQLKDAAGFKVLASPSLVTEEGRPAVVHSGGEFPILIPHGDRATIQYRQFGVRLEAVPTYGDNGQIHVDLAAEVSERDFSNTVEVRGVRVPGITSRDINTGVDLKPGQTLLFAVGISKAVIETGERAKGEEIKTAERATVFAISASPHEDAEPKLNPLPAY